MSTPKPKQPKPELYDQYQDIGIKAVAAAVRRPETSPSGPQEENKTRREPAQGKI